MPSLEVEPSHGNRRCSSSCWRSSRALLPIHAQKLDLNRNGNSDVWEALYNSAGFEPDFDSDADGVINRLEAIAGTDPRDNRSLPKISGYRMTTSNLRDVPCVDGRRAR